MGQYDNYREKIEKISKVKTKLYKYRVLIISLLTVLVLSLSSFVLFKGQIVKDLTLPDKMVYGSDLGFSEPEILFGKASYEFNYGDDNWVKESPSLPGVYSVRVVSRGAFGKTNYGEPQMFTIDAVPTTATILKNEIEYGKDIEVDLNLKYDDEVKNIEFTYDDYTLDKTIARVNLDTLKIVNKNGEDVTNFYDFAPIETPVTFTKKDITLIPNINDELIYNGEDVNYQSELKNPDLSYDDEISFDVQYSKFNEGKNIYEPIAYTPVEIGMYKCDIVKESVSIYNEAPKNKTLAHYNVNFEPTEFKINKRSIEVYTGSESKTYDGELIKNENIADCGITKASPYSLGKDHKLALDPLFVGDKTLINANTYKNKLNLVVLDKNNVDVSKNYDIKYQYGDLTIKKMDLVIEPIELSNMVYDGNSVTYNDLITKLGYVIKNDGVIASGEQLFLNTSFVLNDTKLNEVKNAAKYVVRFDEVNKDKSTIDLNNYNITFNDGSFEILKRDITLLPDISDFEDKVYDGIYTPSSLSTYLLSNSKYGLVDGEVITLNPLYMNILTNEKLTKVKNAGEYKLIANKFLVNNEEKLADNYNIHYDDSLTFKINKRKVSVTPDVSDFTYGDKTLTKNLTAVSVNPEVNDLVNGEQLTLVVDYKNIDSNAVSESISHAGTYTINIKDFEVLNSNKDNYIFDYPSDSLNVTIKKRNLTIGLKEIADKVYDGKETKFNVNDYELINGTSLANSDTLSINVISYLDDIETKAINAGEYLFKIKDYTLTNKDDYNVDVKSTSAFTISRREITVSPNVKDVTYGDYVYTKNNVKPSFENGSLVDNEDLTFEVKYIKDTYNVAEAKHFGTYTTIIDTNTFKINGNDASNYDIKVVNKTFKINPRKITIAPKDATFTYDGKYHNYEMSNNNFDVINGNLVFDDKLQIKVLFNDLEKIKNVGDYLLSLDEGNSVFVGDKGSLDNYDITFSDNHYYHIEKRDLNVTLPDQIDLTYNGNIQFIDASSSVVEGLVEGEHLNVVINYFDEAQNVVDPKDVNTYDYYIDLLNSSITGNDSSLDNYYINSSWKSFKINPLPITLNPKGFGDFTYNDNEVINTGFANFDVLEAKTGFDANDFEVVYNYNGKASAKNAGTYKVTIASINARQNVNKDNYAFSFGTTSFKINPKEITIKPKDIKAYEKDYDGKEFTYPYDYYGNFDYNESSDPLAGDDELRIFTKAYLENQEVLAKNAGTYEFKISKVMFNDPKDADNYIIHYESVSYTINPRKVNFSYKLDHINYGDTVYYGNSVSNITINSGNLVENEEIKLDVKYESQSDLGTYLTNAKNAGKYNVVVNEVYVQNGLASNYEFSYSPFVLDIGELAITLTPNALTNKEYDGKSVTYPNSVNNFTSNIDIPFGDASKMKISVNSSINNLTKEMLDAGTYSLTTNEISYLDGTLANNYVVTFGKLDNALTITPRELVVSFEGTKEKVYDGTFINGESNYHLQEGSLVLNHELVLYVNFVNELTNEETSRISETGTYKVVPADYLITNGNVKNYQVVFDKDYFVTISKRKVNITLNEVVDKIYDGERINVISTPKTKEGLLEGHSLTYEIKYNTSSSLAPYNAGNYYYIIDMNSVTIMDMDKDVTNNYDVTSLGSLKQEFKITPRSVYIKPVTNPLTYDGLVHNELLSVESTLDGLDFIDSDASEVKVKVEAYKDALKVNPKDAGTYDLKIVQVITNEQIKNNYNFMYSDSSSKLVINPRIVNINPSIDNFDYGERVLNTNSCEFSYVYSSDLTTQMVQGEKLQLKVKYFNHKTNELVNEAKNAGMYTVHVDQTDFNVINGKKENYILNLKSDEFDIMIHKRAISIKPLEVKNKIYDGTPLVYPYAEEWNNFVGKEGLVFDDQLKLTNVKFTSNDIESSQFGHAAKYSTYYDYVFNNEEAYSNYDVNKFASEASITPRPISVQPKLIDGKSSKEYDGISYLYPSGYGNYDYVSDSLHFIGDEDIEIYVFFEQNGYSCGNAITSKGSYDQVIYSHSTKYGTLESDYLIDYQSTVVSITNTKLNITLGQMDDITFDGNYHSYNTSTNPIKFEGLKGGDVIDNYAINVLFSTNQPYYFGSSVREAGTYTYTIDEQNLRSYYGFLDNYDINCNQLEFTIKKKKISAIFKDNYLTFNDSRQYLEPKDFIDFGKDISWSDININYDYSEVPYQAGEYEVIINSITSTNYDVNYDKLSRPKLYIKKDIIKVGFNSTVIELKYNGLDQYLNLYTTEKLEFEGAGWTHINGNFSTSTNIYNSKNQLVDKAIDSDTYKVTLETFTTNDEFCNRNYDIVILEDKPLTFKITPIEIRVKPSMKYKTYDGKDLSYDESDWEYVSYSYEVPQADSVLDQTPEIKYVVSDLLPKNYTLTIGNNDRIIGADSVFARATDVKIYDEKGIELPLNTGVGSRKYQNYDIITSDENPECDSYYLGELQIMERYLFVETKGGAFEYDGEPHLVTGYNVLPSKRPTDGLLVGDRIELDSNNMGITDATEDYGTPNELFFKIYNQKNVDVTNSYSIYNVSKMEDYIVVNKRKISITLNVDLNNLVAGSKLSLDQYSVGGKGIVSGQTLTVKVVKKGISNVAEIEILDKEGKFDVSYNYDIEIIEYEGGSK